MDKLLSAGDWRVRQSQVQLDSARTDPPHLGAVDGAVVGDTPPDLVDRLEPSPHFSLRHREGMGKQLPVASHIDDSYQIAKLAVKDGVRMSGRS